MKKFKYIVCRKIETAFFYIVAVCCIVLTMQGEAFQVTDNQPFIPQTFSSIFNLSSLVANESVSVHLQWTDQIP